MGDELQDRIRALEDRTAIGELFSNYCHSVDFAVREVFEPLWLPDAVWAFPAPMRAYEGIDEIMGAWEEITRQTPRNHHVTCDTVLLSLTPDEAVARSGCVVQPGPPEGLMPPLMFAGFDDNLRKVNGTWKFARRSVRVYGDVVLEITEALT